MMKRLVTVILAAVILSSGISAESIYDMIAGGRVKEAQEALSRAVTASSRDGDVLFYQSLLETDAARAAQQMEAALRASVSLKYREEIYYRLAQYYLISGQYLDLARVVNEYRTHWEKGRFDREMNRLAVVVDEKSDDYNSALRQVDRYLVRYPDGDAGQWGTVDKARVLMADNKRIGAVKMLRNLTREREGAGVSQALYMLAHDAYEHDQYDDAVFYYNLLRERYPGAVGLDNLIEQLGSISEREERDKTAARITGTYYTVKVGVFSEEKNARRQRDIFKSYGKDIDIGTKNISGKTYHVVYVGRFTSYSEAANFKDILEANHSEVYQVVAR